MILTTKCSGIIRSVFASNMHTPYRGPTKVVFKTSIEPAYMQGAIVTLPETLSKQGIFVLDGLMLDEESNVTLYLGNIGSRDYEYIEGEVLAFCDTSASY